MDLLQSLFLTILLGVGLVSCRTTIKLGDGTSLVNGILTCNGIQCPEGSNKCSVYETSQHSMNNSMRSTKIDCTDVHDGVLLDRVINATNPSGKWVNNLSELSVSGDAFNCISCEGDSPKEIRENYEKRMAEYQRQMEEKMAELKRRLAEMQERLSHLGEGILSNLK